MLPAADDMHVRAYLLDAEIRPICLSMTFPKIIFLNHFFGFCFVEGKRIMIP